LASSEVLPKTTQKPPLKVDGLTIVVTGLGIECEIAQVG